MRHLLLLIALGGLLLYLVLRSTDDTIPAISVDFTGKTAGGLHVNPFGQFILSNQWNRPVEWGRNGVEAPGDPDLGWSARVDSNIPHGILNAGALTNFKALIPHTKGVSFRLLIGYRVVPDPLDRIRAKLPSMADRFWPRKDVWQTFTSQWFYATTGYTNEMTARSAAARALLASQPANTTNSIRTKLKGASLPAPTLDGR